MDLGKQVLVSLSFCEHGVSCCHLGLIEILDSFNLRLDLNKEINDIAYSDE